MTTQISSLRQYPINLTLCCLRAVFGCGRKLAGCTVVSIDNRLAPAVELPAIIEDLRDAITWIKT